MKILCTEYNKDRQIAIVPMGDDVLLRNNGDFYIPEFSAAVSCVPQLIVRLGKLGKSVGERFACRYFEEIGVGVRFYADDFQRELKQKDLPEIMASSFDCSAAISDLEKIGDSRDARYVMRVNGATVFDGNRRQLPVGVERLVSLASDFHTLKIGDFLYCGNTYRYGGLKSGDRIQMDLNDKAKLDFEVK